MSDDITLRDTFAAAALTGWLASQQTVVSAAAMASHAYEYADAMLRQRALSLQSEAGEKPLRNGAVSSRETVQPAATTVDAAVVDTAPSPNSVDAQPPTCDGARQSFDSTSTDHDEASGWCGEGQEIVPPYRDPPPPALTDAEREAIKSAIGDYEANDMDAGCWQMAATLRALLARLGGER